MIGKKASVLILCVVFALADPPASHANFLSSIGSVFKDIEKAIVHVVVQVADAIGSLLGEKSASQGNSSSSKPSGTSVQSSPLGGPSVNNVPNPAPTVTTPIPQVVQPVTGSPTTPAGGTVKNVVVPAQPNPDSTQFVQQASPPANNSAASAGNAGSGLPNANLLSDLSAIPPVGPGVAVRGVSAKNQSSDSASNSLLASLSSMNGSISETPNIPGSGNPTQGISSPPVVPAVGGSMPGQQGTAQDPNALANQFVQSAQKRFNTAAHPYDYTSVIQDLNQAISLAPDYDKAYTLRATAYNAIGDYADAAADSLKALRRNPKNTAALMDLAVTQLMQGDYANSKEIADRALALDPNSGEAYWIRALALDALGQHDAAMADALKAAELEPNKFLAKYEAIKRGAKLFDPNAKDASYLFRDNPTSSGNGHVRWPMVGVGGVFLLLLGFAAARARSKYSWDSSMAIPMAAGFNGDDNLAGKYQMMGIIGRGGMGEVYEALDQSLNRRVAIKKVSQGLASAVESRMRNFLLKEAKTVAALHHPAIVDIYEILERDSDIYLVFELVKGKTLQQILVENVRLGVTHAVEILKPVCQALAFAHSQNVVHRDLKPSNIMVTEQGNVKVMDFGIARQVAERVAPEGGNRITSAKDNLHAYTTTIVGTPIYMAPEMEEGIVSKESDIYALGCCLYEILTGTPAFPARTGAVEKLDMNFIPVGSKVAGVPAAIDALLREALDPHMERRPKTPIEFLTKLESAAASARLPSSSAAALR